MSGKWDGGRLRVVTVAVNVSKEKCGDPLGMGSLSRHCARDGDLILALWSEARAALCPPAPEPAPSCTGAQAPEAALGSLICDLETEASRETQ